MLGDPRDVELDHVARQAEGRHSDQACAAARRKRLVDVHLVAVRGELLGDGQARRSRAHHAHAPASGPCDLHVVGHVVAVMPVDQEALHGADGEWLVDVGAPAGLLTRRAAYIAADRSDRVRVARQDVALFEAALRREHQVTTAVGIDRAAFLAFDVALQPIDADLGCLEPQRDCVLCDHERSLIGSTLGAGGISRGGREGDTREERRGVPDGQPDEEPKQGTTVSRCYRSPLQRVKEGLGDRRAAGAPHQRKK